MAKKQKRVRKHRQVSPKTLWKMMEKHDVPMGFDVLMADDAPPWAKRLGEMFMRSLFPGLKIAPELIFDPKFLGALAAKAAISNKLLTGQLELPPATAAELEEFLQAVKPSKAQIKQSAAEAKKLVQVQEQMSDETMPLVPNLKPEDQLRFMEGYNQALRHGLEALDSSLQPVEHKIVQRFFMRWPWFARMKSVSEVHKAIAVPFANDGVVISRERIAKLCQRIGLSFRGRGRPRKSDK